MFDDQQIERSQTIPLALRLAIRESKISIVVLSKNYASSSWCLKELVEILECKKDTGQIVMTIFYEVDPSDVRKQTGDFGRVFSVTCSRNTDEDTRRWRKALNEVGNIVGEHFLNWDNEAKMIETVAKDVLDKLNATPCRDFEGMVGLEAHLREMDSLLELDYDGVKMVAVSGPAGIGFTKFFRRIIELCGNLPLGLRVVGSSLRGKEEDEWEDVVNRLETILDRDIEDVLRVGYDTLDENDQTLFLHIAVFFDCKYSDLVKAMFIDGNLDVKRGLKILVYRSLIDISTYGEKIEVHRLLQEMGRKAIRKQEPWKRQILMDAHEICDVLENETGTSNVSGISFDISGINEIVVSQRPFKRMANLHFLSVHKSIDDGKDRMYILEEMEFPRRLSKLEYLWQGTPKLTNLKKMDFSRSFHLKELPDLSTATTLEELNVAECKCLEEFPSSFRYLQKLQELYMGECINLQVTLHLT
ncbi:hypothetical protein AALP_AA2G020600 [Arabis alpina]|uniref:TIR domain-containing protein n=1 Tax=Arabis alpina TaxID=50452 RepID=A0A087HES4_ARAAL|nr:hypothetical protein AALP_AA2G020600 [Arabis alpina]